MIVEANAEVMHINITEMQNSDGILEITNDIRELSFSVTANHSKVYPLIRK